MRETVVIPAHTGSHCERSAAIQGSLQVSGVLNRV